jgi:hypothetical protein
MGLNNQVVPLLVAAFMTTAACSTTLRDRADVKSVHFTVGATRKLDVANVLGLPSERVVADGYEYWGYADHVQLVAVIYPRFGGNRTMGDRAEWHRLDQHLPTPYVYVFDAAGLLVATQRPER